MSGRLRPGNSGANTAAADHIAVLDDALARIPDAHRHGTAILVRADSAGSAKAFLAHIRTLREHGLDLRFSVGYAVTEPVRRAIRSLPEHLWHPALDQNGTLREGAAVAELTGMVDIAARLTRGGRRLATTCTAAPMPRRALNRLPTWWGPPSRVSGLRVSAVVAPPEVCAGKPRHKRLKVIRHTPVGSKVGDRGPGGPVQSGMAASTRVAATVRAAVSALGSRSSQALIPAPS